MCMRFAAEAGVGGRCGQDGGELSSAGCWASGSAKGRLGLWGRRIQAQQDRCAGYVPVCRMLLF